MRWILILAFAAWLGPASGQSAFSIEGRWFGTFKSEQGDRHCWLSNRRGDGTYLTDFFTEEAGVFERYTEGGRWAQSPTAFLIQVENRNGAAVAPRRFQYAIVEVTPETLVYQHLESGMRFSTRRVADDFQLPERCGPARQ